MKVVHVHRIRGIGGSERHLLTLLPALAERGIEPASSGSTTRAGALEPFYQELAARSVRLPCPRDLDPVLLRRVRGELARLRPDIVHTHLVHADVYGALGAGGVPVVSTKHNDDPFRRGPFRYVERLLTRRARRVIAITEALARYCIERGRPAGGEDRGRPLRARRPAGAWGRGPGLAAGRGAGAPVRLAAREQKGVDVAVRALARVARDRAAGGAGRARRGPASARGWPADGVVPAGPRGRRRVVATGAPSCSSTRRAGRASGLRSSRRCWRRSRWWRRE